MLKGIADGSLKKKMRRLSKNLQTVEKRNVRDEQEEIFREGESIKNVVSQIFNACTVECTEAEFMRVQFC
jgi:nucleoid DNA-binding protein